MEAGGTRWREGKAVSAPSLYGVLPVICTWHLPPYLPLYLGSSSGHPGIAMLRSHGDHCNRRLSHFIRSFSS